MPSDWARGPAVGASAVAVEVFLPLAFRDEPSSWRWSATGAMFVCSLRVDDGGRLCQRREEETAGVLYKAKMPTPGGPWSLRHPHLPPSC